MKVVKKPASTAFCIAWCWRKSRKSTAAIHPWYARAIAQGVCFSVAAFVMLPLGETIQILADLKLRFQILVLRLQNANLKRKLSACFKGGDSSPNFLQRGKNRFKHPGSSPLFREQFKTPSEGGK